MKIEESHPTIPMQPVASEATPAPAQQPPSKKGGCLWLLRHWQLTLMAVAVVIIGFSAWRIYSLATGDEPLIGIRHNTAIADTPEEIRALRDIGQWEFLAAPCEEIIERHEAHTFGDKHLVKVFRGTLSIGIDMHKASDDWFAADTTSAVISPGVLVEGGKAAILTLPDVELLDESFIDEARTTTFHEQGTFSSKVKQELYDEAVAAMKKRILTPKNLEAARQNARDQFTRIFHAFGYDKVSINFLPTEEKEQQNQ